MFLFEHYLQVVEDLTTKANAESITFHDWEIGRKANTAFEKTLILRHDVDHSLEKAVKFADAEARNNISATYFLLPSASYFDYSKRLEYLCEKILSRGHHLGFHNDMLTQYLSDCASISSRSEWLINMKRALDFLKGLMGTERIMGTSAYGAGDCYLKGYYNYELWEQFDPEKNEKPKRKVTECFPVLNMDVTGLEYETYFLDFRFYMSDSKKFGWNGYIVDDVLAAGKPKFFERTLKEDHDINRGFSTIGAFQRSGAGMFQLLVHPIWWRL